MATRSSTRRTKNSKTNWVLVPNYRRAARSSPAGQPRTGSPASRIQAVGGHGCSPPRQIRRQDTGSTASRGGLRRPGRTTAGRRLRSASVDSQIPGPPPRLPHAGETPQI